MTSWLPPDCSAAALAPSFELWLNDLSSSCPTSVTTPTLIGVRAAPDGDTPPEGSAEPAVDGAVDGAATDADGLCVAPGPQAATTMARAPNSVRPRERLRMCPPPTSRSLRRPLRRETGPVGSRRTFAPRGDHWRASYRRRPGRASLCEQVQSHRRRRKRSRRIGPRRAPVHTGRVPIDVRVGRSAAGLAYEVAGSGAPLVGGLARPCRAGRSVVRQPDGRAPQRLARRGGGARPWRPRPSRRGEPEGLGRRSVAR